MPGVAVEFKQLNFKQFFKKIFIKHSDSQSKKLVIFIDHQLIIKKIRNTFSTFFLYFVRNEELLKIFRYIKRVVRNDERNIRNISQFLNLLHSLCYFEQNVRYIKMRFLKVP